MIKETPKLSKFGYFEANALTQSNISEEIKDLEIKLRNVSELFCEKHRIMECAYQNKDFAKKEGLTEGDLFLLSYLDTASYKLLCMHTSLMNILNTNMDIYEDLTQILNAEEDTMEEM